MKFILGKLKVYELAKELGVQSKEIIEKANALGAKISSHLGSIDEDLANTIRKKYNKECKRAKR